MTDIIEKSITNLAALIRSREISPVEVVQAYLDRIDQINPKLNAIVTLGPDVLEKARKAEAAVVRGDVLGPLHGIPLTIKDTIETKGLRTTSGSAVHADFVPERDAAAVARLKAAGAIILGKTNTAEMAMDYSADNPVFGRTNNPHDPLLTPGGSSGGEAAAIAAFISPGGIGSDLAGSIRIPAHFCGIAGLKPTVGRVPGGGQFPPSTGPYSLGAVIGPMARSIEDLGLLFASLTAGANFSPKANPDLRRLRVAWYTDDRVAPVNTETRAAVESAATALTSAGLCPEEILPPGIEFGHALWLQLFSRASVVQLRNVYQNNSHVAGSFVRWRLATADAAPIPTLDDFIQAWIERDRLREGLLRWMNDFPLILAPVGSVTALPHDALKVAVADQQISVFRAFSYSQTFNVFDLPAVCVPVGHSRCGPAIGVQIAGMPFQEQMILAAARILEKVWR